MTIATTDWGTIGTGIAVAVIAGMQYYNLHRSKKRDAVVATIKEVVVDVHKLTNGNLGEQLKIGMISAQTLANVKPNPEHVKLAEAATAKYKAHLATEIEIKKEKSESPK